MQYLTQKKIIMIFFRMKMHLTKNKGDFAMRKTKILTKAAAVVSAAVMALGCAMPVAAVGTNNLGFKLEYVENAPSGIYKNSGTYNLVSNGGEYVTIKTSKLYSYVSGGYVHCTETNYGTTPINITSAGTYKMYFGSNRPKKNQYVNVHLSLENCSYSKHIIAQGNIIA